MRFVPRTVIVASLALLPLTASAENLGIFKISAAGRCSVSSGSDGTLTVASPTAELDFTLTFNGATTLPRTSARVDEGGIESLTLELGVDLPSTRQKELLTLTFESLGIPNSKFDGRFLQARDLIREQQVLQLCPGPCAGEATIKMLRIDSGGATAPMKTVDGIAPFVIDGPITADYAAIVSDGTTEHVVVTLTRDNGVAVTEDGQRIDFDLIEIQLPLEGHELGHVLGFRHEHVKGAARMTFNLAN